MRAARVIAVFCVCGALSSAAETRYWIDVPFVEQTPDGCGSASVAMVIKYWDHQQGRPDRQAPDVNSIQRDLFSPQAHGIYAHALVRYLEKEGFKTYTFQGDQALLAEHVKAGRPLIVALRPGSSRLHYVVVSGIDSEQSLLLLNDPARRKLLKVGLPEFEREWKAASNWTLLAVPRSSTP